MYLFEDLSNISAFTWLAAGCPGSCPSLRVCNMSSAVSSCPSPHNPLYCTVLYCTVLYCTVLYCSVLSPTTQPTCPSPACCRQSSSGSSWSPWTHCTCTHTSPVNSGIQLLSVSSPTWSGRSRGWSSRTPGGCVPTAPSPSRASSWCRPPRSAPHLGPPWSCTKL